MTETERAIAEIVTDVTEGPELGIDDELFEAGATSLEFLRILTSINRRFEVAVTGAELDEVTVRRLAACVDEGLACASAVPG